MQMEEKLDKIEFILEHFREPERLLEEEFMNWLQEEGINTCSRKWSQTEWHS